MATFTWTSNPITFASGINTPPLNAVFNQLAGFILATPANVDTSALNIYNAGAQNFLTGNSPATNLISLNAVIGLFTAGGGGKFLIPGGPNDYTVNSGATPLPDEVQIEGTHPGTLIQVANAGDLFTLAGATNAFGIKFKNIEFFNASYTSGYILNSQNNGAQNVRFEDCYFQKCAATRLGDNSLASGLANCVIDYSTCATTGVSLTYFSGSQDYLISSVIRQQPINFTPHGATGNTAVQLDRVSTFYGAFDHLSDCDYGITFGKGWIDAFWFGCRIDAQTSAMVFAQTNSNVVSTAKFVGCHMAQAASLPAPSNSCIYVDTNGQPNTSLDDIQFIGHTTNLAQGHGLEFHAGNRGSVIGGRFSSNGLAGGSYANVCVSGGNFWDFVGVDMSGTLLGAPVGFTGATPYGFMFTAPAGTVCKLTACDFTGCGTAPLLGNAATQAGTATLVVRDCRAYSDQHTVINGSAAPTGTAHCAAFYSYYGKSVYRWNNATAITVTVNGGIGRSATAGETWLESPYDTLLVSASPTSQEWIGY